MNEAEILMYLLSRNKDSTTIGATKAELCAKLGLTDRNADYKFWNLLQGLNSSLFSLGLSVKFNPMNSHWFIGFQDKMENEFSGHFKSLSPRLSATLFTILVVYISKDTVITPTKIRELRNKKDISKDLEDLNRLGFITIQDNSVTPTPKIFYYININELIEKVKGLKEN